MYHKLKIDVSFLKKGAYIFVNEDQAASLIESGRIEEKGHEANPDEKAAEEDNIDPVIEPDNDDDNAEANPDEKAAGKPGRKPKVSSIQNTLQ